VSCRPGFFLPVRVLSRLFRRLFLSKLLAAHQAGRLAFFGDHAGLAASGAFTAFLAPLRKTEWVVYAKKPFAGPQAVLAYLSRYTHRVAISNRRLISANEMGAGEGLDERSGRCRTELAVRLWADLLIRSKRGLCWPGASRNGERHWAGASVVTAS
jgi:hypothetical protein